MFTRLNTSRNLMIAAIFTVAFATATSSAQATQFPDQRIGATYGWHSLAGETVHFISFEYQGSFDYNTISNKFHANKDWYKNNLQSNNIKPNSFSRKLAGDRHLVLGWYNVSRNTFGWVGVRIGLDGRSSQYLTHNGNLFATTGWESSVWRNNDTNGQQICIRFGDDDSYGVRWQFELNQ